MSTDRDRAFDLVVAGLVKEVADADCSGGLAGEVHREGRSGTPEAAHIGFSSCPPFCRFMRVTPKSAKLDAAAAIKSDDSSCPRSDARNRAPMAQE